MSELPDEFSVAGLDFAADCDEALPTFNRS